MTAGRKPQNRTPHSTGARRNFRKLALDGPPHPLSRFGNCNWQRSTHVWSLALPARFRVSRCSHSTRFSSFRVSAPITASSVLSAHFAGSFHSRLRSAPMAVLG